MEGLRAKGNGEQGPLSEAGCQETIFEINLFSCRKLCFHLFQYSFTPCYPDTAARRGGPSLTNRGPRRKQPPSMLIAHWKLLKKQRRAWKEQGFNSKSLCFKQKTDFILVGDEHQFFLHKMRTDSYIEAQGELLKLQKGLQLGNLAKVEVTLPEQPGHLDRQCRCHPGIHVPSLGFPAGEWVESTGSRASGAKDRPGQLTGSEEAGRPP